MKEDVVVSTMFSVLLHVQMGHVEIPQEEEMFWFQPFVRGLFKTILKPSETSL